MSAKDLLGTWKLASLELRNENGEISRPAGDDPVGHLIYAGDGYMSVTIMHANRSPFASEDMARGTRDEKARAAETYLSYSGRYTVTEDKIIHHIEVSLFPNWIGSDQERFFLLKGDCLQLRTAPYPVNKAVQEACLTWERVSA